jgi:hypothetical protein
MSASSASQSAPDVCPERAAGSLEPLADANSTHEMDAGRLQPKEADNLKPTCCVCHSITCGQKELQFATVVTQSSCADVFGIICDTCLKEDRVFVFAGWTDLKRMFMNAMEKKWVLHDILHDDMKMRPVKWFRVSWFLIPRFLVSDSAFLGFWFRFSWFLIPRFLVSDSAFLGFWFEKPGFWFRGSWFLIPRFLVSDSKWTWFLIQNVPGFWFSFGWFLIQLFWFLMQLSTARE